MTPSSPSRYPTRRKNTMVQTWVVLGFQAPFSAECETLVPDVCYTDRGRRHDRGALDDLLAFFHTVRCACACCPFTTICTTRCAFAHSRLLRHRPPRFRDHTESGANISTPTTRLSSSFVLLQSLIVVPADYRSPQENHAVFHLTHCELFLGYPGRTVGDLRDVIQADAGRNLIWDSHQSRISTLPHDRLGVCWVRT